VRHEVPYETCPKKTVFGLIQLPWGVKTRLGCQLARASCSFTAAFLTLVAVAPLIVAKPQIVRHRLCLPSVIVPPLFKKLLMRSAAVEGLGTCFIISSFRQVTAKAYAPNMRRR